MERAERQWLEERQRAETAQQQEREGRQRLENAERQKREGRQRLEDAEQREREGRVRAERQTIELQQVSQLYFLKVNISHFVLDNLT